MSSCIETGFCATSSLSVAIDLDGVNERLLCTGKRIVFVETEVSLDDGPPPGRFCAELAVCGRSFVDGLAFLAGGRVIADPGRDALPAPRLPGILNGKSRRGGISSSNVSAMVNDAADGIDMAEDGRTSPVGLKGKALCGGSSCSNVSGKMDVAVVTERAVEGRASMGSEDRAEV